MSIEDDGALTAEEQAQFDSMRDSAVPGSNATSPDQLLQPDPIAPTEGTPAPDKPAAQIAPAAPGEPSLTGEDDPDVETIKDATGKAVIDVATGKPQKRVSFHKFQRTANELVELRKQLATSADERARLDERLTIINEALMTPPAAPAAAENEDPEPDVDNIFEWAKWSKREMDRRTTQFQNFVDQANAEREDNQIATAYRRDANQFASTEPNFGHAYKFLMDHRSAQLRAAGWTDELKIQTQLVKEEKGLVRNAMTAKVSPAKRIFDMAAAAGFTAPVAPAPAPKPNGGAAPAPAVPVAPGTPLNGPIPQVPAVAARPTGIPSVAEQVALAAQGAEAAKTLSGGGGAPMEPLTPQKLLTMDEDEFAAVVDGLSKAKLRELFGD